MKHTLAFGNHGSFCLVIGLTREDLIDLNEEAIPCITAFYGDKRVAITLILDDDQASLDEMYRRQVGLVRGDIDTEGGL